MTAFASRAWWPWAKRGATVVFFALVVGLLAHQARAIEWSQVATSLAEYPVLAAWEAVLLTLASFLLYSCFDLIGRQATGHPLSTAWVMAITFVSYAFNLNLGSVVGGVAFRLRMYTRMALGVPTITRIMALSMLANWTGYLLLGGLIFTVAPPTLPEHWLIDSRGLRWVGMALLAVALLYAGVCGASKQRSFTVRGHTLELPSLRLAALQMTMGAGNWLLMSGILYILLQHKIEFSAVVGVLLLASIAAVITHIPAGLGVLEAVFVALLSHQMPQHDILASLVAYRLVYYITPLVIATGAFLLMESRAKLLQTAAHNALSSAKSLR